MNEMSRLEHRMRIRNGGLDDLRVQELLHYHFVSARNETAPGSAHALDLHGLGMPGVHFWSAWDGDNVVAVGALKCLSDVHGEIKSMHTDRRYRRQGAGKAMLRHIIGEARRMGLTRLSLETGSWSYFARAKDSIRNMDLSSAPRLETMPMIQTVFS